MNEEDAEYLKRYQRGAAAGNNPAMAGGVFLESQGEAMRNAASNPNGAMGGFFGMGMAMNAGGNTAQNLFAMGQQQQQQPQYQQPQQQGYGQPQQQAPAQGGWTCSCGNQVSGNFCPNCGNKKPEPQAANGWQCTQCGSTNQGKFCMNCGAPKPAGAPIYRCDKCGWQPDDPHNPPKFCMNCGDPFDDNDIQK